MFICEALWVCLVYEKRYINKVALPCLSGVPTLIRSGDSFIRCSYIDPIRWSLYPVFLHWSDQVVPGNSVQILDGGRTLRLLKAAPADAGSYSCKAINIAGSTDKDFFLDVLGQSACPKPSSSSMHWESLTFITVEYRWWVYEWVHVHHSTFGDK